MDYNYKDVDFSIGFSSSQYILFIRKTFTTLKNKPKYKLEIRENINKTTHIKTQNELPFIFKNSLLNNHLCVDFCKICVLPLSYVSYR